jgi:hypothetical protein
MNNKQSFLGEKGHRLSHGPELFNGRLRRIKYGGIGGQSSLITDGAFYLI